MKIKINNYINESYVDGPGIRFTLFTQGCPHHCLGCHNPQTHDFNQGIEMETQDIVNKMVKNPLLDGITISGGEPFCQIEGCLDLLKRLQQVHLNYDVIVYTGYLMEDLLKLSENNASLKEFLSLIDYIIDGPFILERRDLDIDFRGSNNQRIIDSKRSIKENCVIETHFEM